jgi:hypothetical protein
MRFDIKTKASPEQVHRALTDFTDARLDIWTRSLDPKTYELRDKGPTWAVARESSPRSPFWVVVRYDWSDPKSVRWTVLDSSYGEVERAWFRSHQGTMVAAGFTHSGATPVPARCNGRCSSSSITDRCPD